MITPYFTSSSPPKESLADDEELIDGSLGTGRKRGGADSSYGSSMTSKTATKDFWPPTHLLNV